MITIGADPELFIRDSKTNKIVPAIGKVGGSKDNPRPVSSGAVQEDNVMAEFNITPATNRNEFIRNIRTVMEQLESILNPQGLELDKSVISTHEFSDKDLESPAAQTFGCDPDMSVYTLKNNPKISPKAVGNLRMCGGHIHVGFTDPEVHPWLRVKTVLYMDLYVGLPLALLEPAESKRHLFYGKAGSFRIKPYGVEYRTPSNIWLKNDKLMEFVYNASYDAAKLALARAAAYDDLPRNLGQLIDNRELSTLKHIAGRWGITIPKL